VEHLVLVVAEGHSVAVREFVVDAVVVRVEAPRVHVEGVLHDLHVADVVRVGVRDDDGVEVTTCLRMRETTS